MVLLLIANDYFTSCMGFAFREEMWSTRQETEASIEGCAATLCHWVSLLGTPTLSVEGTTFLRNVGKQRDDTASRSGRPDYSRNRILPPPRYSCPRMLR